MLQLNSGTSALAMQQLSTPFQLQHVQETALEERQKGTAAPSNDLKPVPALLKPSVTVGESSSNQKVHFFLLNTGCGSIKFASSFSTVNYFPLE